MILDQDNQDKNKTTQQLSTNSNVINNKKKNINNQINQSKRLQSGNGNEDIIGPNPRKIRKTDYYDLILDSLPSAQSYQISLMHRDIISHIIVSHEHDTIITCSIDGHIKFWRKVFSLVEALKTFKAHNGPLNGTCLSKNKQFLGTVGVDKILRIFDVQACQLKNSLKLNFVPVCCQFIPSKNGSDCPMIALGQQKSGRIMYINYQQKEQVPLQKQQQNILIGQQKKQKQIQTQTLPTNIGYNKSIDDSYSHVIEIINIHKHPIKFIKMNWKYNICISIDQRSFLEIWNPITLDFPNNLQYQCKIQSQFLQLLQINSIPISVTLSPKGKYIGIMFKDKTIKLYNIINGKCILTIIDSIKQITKIQDNSNHQFYPLYNLDHQNLDRKITLEKDVQISKELLNNPGLDFDQAQQYLIYPSLVGIVFYSIQKNMPERVLGKRETQRFLKCVIYQGRIMRNPAGSSTNQGQRKSFDPLLICTAFKKPRFYIFSRRQPQFQQNIPVLVRDIQNQRTNKQQLHSQVHQKHEEAVGNQVVLQTTHGDIYLYLYVEDCPKTCENFIKLVKKGYYNGMIFHRVIKGFMNQTGCPNGDGTGGQSIWGGPFQDQLLPHKYRFEKPYVLAMANRGPNTNTSQFFITVVACPWLDNKHTIFGRVIRGIQTVCQINKIKTDKTQKPLINIKIMSAKVI